MESIYRSYTLCIWPDSEPTKLLNHPKQKNYEGREPQTDKHLPPNPFTGQFFMKRRPLGFGVFIVVCSIGGGVEVVTNQAEG